MVVTHFLDLVSVSSTVFNGRYIMEIILKKKKNPHTNMSYLHVSHYQNIVLIKTNVVLQLNQNYFFKTVLKKIN